MPRYDIVLVYAPPKQSPAPRYTFRIIGEPKMDAATGRNVQQVSFNKNQLLAAMQAEGVQEQLAEFGVFERPDIVISKWMDKVSSGEPLHTLVIVPDGHNTNCGAVDDWIYKSMKAAAEKIMSRFGSKDSMSDRLKVLNTAMRSTMDMRGILLGIAGATVVQTLNGLAIEPAMEQIVENYLAQDREARLGHKSHPIGSIVSRYAYTDRDGKVRYPATDGDYQEFEKQRIVIDGKLRTAKGKDVTEEIAVHLGMVDAKVHVNESGRREGEMEMYQKADHIISNGVDFEGEVTGGATPITAYIHKNHNDMLGKYISFNRFLDEKGVPFAPTDMASYGTAHGYDMNVYDGQAFGTHLMPYIDVSTIEAQGYEEEKAEEAPASESESETESDGDASDDEAAMYEVAPDVAEGDAAVYHRRRRTRGRHSHARRSHRSRSRKGRSRSRSRSRRSRRSRSRK